MSGSGEGKPGMSWREIAASSYNVFLIKLLKTQDVEKIFPAFENLPRNFQVSWEASVRHAVNLSQKDYSGSPPEKQEILEAEKKWLTWVPPSVKFNFEKDF